MRKIPDSQPPEITPLDEPEIEQGTPHPDVSEPGDMAAKAPGYRQGQ